MANGGPVEGIIPPEPLGLSPPFSMSLQPALSVLVFAEYNGHPDSRGRKGHFLELAGLQGGL
jgi:hypothetical protein